MIKVAKLNQISLLLWLMFRKWIMGFYLNVYGNPSSDEIIIKGSAPANQVLQIQLSNSLGQILMVTKETVSSNFKKTIGVKDLATGIYFIRFHSSTFTRNLKVMVVN
jgi:hypothetical protein